ncbi:ribonuclease P protein component [Aliisedimentitalea scapharcae]|uniref:Ribonuclease P protein component n=1 Tax=Aliisedimentitalea scapharcae TaxID=1524259 RepID=A0ABZ2XVJ7_9RHOB
MMPPEAPADGNTATGETPPAVSVCASPLPGLTVMAKRRDFLAAARARRQGTQGMMVQARNRRDDDATIRVGFTCSKKVGNAVARNRAKRRLREIARMVLPELGRPGWDYVLIGRRDETGTRDFTALESDFRYALRKLHAPKTAPDK